VVSWTINFLNLGYNFPMMVLQRPCRGYSIVQFVHDTHKPLAYLSIPANASNEHIRLPWGHGLGLQQPILWIRTYLS
jgi:hypothetical protein